MNKILLLGRTTKQPELKIASNGSAYTIITLAVDDRGNEKQPVDFFDIKVFGKSADIICKFVGKGQGLLIEAKAKQHVYEKEDGTKVYSIDFILQGFEFVGSTPKAEGTTETEETEAEEQDENNLPW